MRNILFLVVFISSVAGAQTVEVLYTTEALRVSGASYQIIPAGVDVTYFDLDAPVRLNEERQRALILDSNAQRSAQRATTWLKSAAGVEHAQKLRAAYEGYTKVVTYGIKKLPAVVIDGQYVFYGVRNLETAINVLAKAHGRGY